MITVIGKIKVYTQGAGIYILKLIPIGGKRTISITINPIPPNITLNNQATKITLLL
jgi:hypothetical protein